MKNKRGSHIDVIISFVIFVGFIVFFYAIIQPSFVNTSRDKSVIFNSLYLELKQNLTGINNSIIGVRINLQKSSQNYCIILTNFVGVAGLQSPPQIIVYNETGGIYPAYISSKNGQDLYINMSNPSSVLLNIYSSQLFSQIPQNPSGLTPCTSLSYNNQNNNYTIGEIQNSSYNYISDANVKQLINEYNSNYNAVKIWFNLTANTDFGFSFDYQNLTSIGTNDKPPAYKNVYAETFPIIYLTQNNSLQSGNLVIRIW